MSLLLIGSLQQLILLKSIIYDHSMMEKQEPNWAFLAYHWRSIL